MKIKGKNWIEAKQTEIDGIIFASKSEAARYSDLKILQLAREISDLTCHTEYPLTILGKCIGHYTDDFSYYEKGSEVLQVEDVKGFTTPQARLRMKVFEACYPEHSFWIYKSGRRMKLNERAPRKRKRGAAAGRAAPRSRRVKKGA